jgi:glutamate-1-semialdehyde 2,1-aminomutase
LLAGVPMNWMIKWAGSFPVFVTGGQGAHFAMSMGMTTSIQLGDTGAMTGHAPIQY